MTDGPSTSRQILAGDCAVLGANWDGEGTNFALFSAYANRVELCLFDEASGTEIERLTLPEYTNEIWHGYQRHWHWKYRIPAIHASCR